MGAIAAGFGAVSSWVEHADNANISDAAAIPLTENMLFILSSR